MTHAVSKIGLIFLGLVMILFILFYSFKNVQSDSNDEGIQETLKTCLLANADNSARCDEKHFHFDQHQFESDFIAKINKNKSLSKQIEDCRFDYLYPDPHNHEIIKAVKVKVKFVDQWYQGSFVLDHGGNNVPK
jgi:hypothetical protein